MLEQWIIDQGADLQVGVFFGFYSFFLLAEVYMPQRRTSPKRRIRWPVNFLLSVINIMVLSLLPISLFGLATWAESQQIGLLNELTLPIAVFIISNLLLRGFISFFTHWLMHKIPWMWRLHRVHHLDTELDVTSTLRFHPLEFLATLVSGMLLVIAFGLSPWLLLVYELLDATVTVFSHSNITIPRLMDRGLRMFIVTPNLHRIHHSSWQPETDSNFSAVFPIWDIIFGTFRSQSRELQATMDLGLEDIRDRRVHQLFWLLRSPFLQLGGSDPLIPKLHS